MKNTSINASSSEEKRVAKLFKVDCAGKDVRSFDGEARERFCEVWLHALGIAEVPPSIECFGIYTGPKSHVPEVIIVGTKDNFVRFAKGDPSPYAEKGGKSLTLPENDEKDLVKFVWYVLHRMNWASVLKKQDIKSFDFEPIDDNFLVELFKACGGGAAQNEVTSYRVDRKMAIAQSATHYCALLPNGTCYFGELGGKVSECSADLAKVICKHVLGNVNIDENPSNEAGVTKSVDENRSSDKKKRVLKIEDWQINFVKQKFEFVADHGVFVTAKTVGELMGGSNISSIRYSQIMEELGAKIANKKIEGKTTRIYLGVKLPDDANE